jgi:hypothetical protein
MALFRTHREAAKANNRMILGFFGSIAVVTLWYAAIVGVHYLLGWW